jgi:hypothetical protein
VKPGDEGVDEPTIAGWEPTQHLAWITRWQAEAIRNATGHLAISGNVAKKTLLKLSEMAAME